MIGFYFFSLLLSELYPQSINKHIEHRIIHSARELYKSEQEYESFFTGYKNGRLATYTDSIMMHTILASDAVSPFKASIGAPLYGDTYAPSQLKELYETSTYTQDDDITYYSRYWHGYRLWLKFLFMFFSYQQIRLVNTYTFYLLLFGCLSYLYKKVDWKLSIAFLLSVIITNISLIPMCLSYICVYIISFISTVIAIHVYISSRKHMEILFFIIGSTTMFFDFYTYPYLTLGYPLIGVLSYAIKRKSQEGLTKLALRCILTWTLGYLLTWGANVLLASLILGANDLDTTKNVLKYRLNKYESSSNLISSIGSFFTNTYFSLSALFNELFVKPHLNIITIFIIIWAALIIPFHNKIIKFKDYLCFLPMMIYIILWFAVASYPVVYTHYKGMAFFVYVVTYFLLLNLDFSKINNIFSNIKQNKKHTPID